MHTHSMRIQYPQDGDKHVTWEPDDAKSVAKAKKAFDTAIGKGHKAFRVESKATPGEAVSEFDPTHKELLLIAGMSGG